MTHSQKLTRIVICADLCVRVIWRGLKNVSMLEDILSNCEIEQFLFNA